MNALNVALGGSSGDKIYGVSFQDDSNGGTNVVYSLDVDVVGDISAEGFGDNLETAIRAEPGLESLFSNICFLSQTKLIFYFQNLLFFFF
jgi:hypothetical protein